MPFRPRNPSCPYYANFPSMRYETSARRQDINPNQIEGLSGEDSGGNWLEPQKGSWLAENKTLVFATLGVIILGLGIAYATRRRK